MVALAIGSLVMLGIGKQSLKIGGEGHALDGDGGWVWEAGGYPVGAETITIMVVLQNRSDEPIVLRGIRAVPGRGLGRVADVLDVTIGDEHGEHVSGLGQYATDPPVSNLNGPGQPEECVQETLLPVDGYVLEPYGKDELSAVVVVHFRTLSPGRAVVSAYDVFYETNGTLFVQRLPTKVIIGVDDDDRPLSVSSDQRYCRRDSRLLPGNRPRTRAQEIPKDSLE